jgi:protease IV
MRAWTRVAAGVGVVLAGACVALGQVRVGTIELRGTPAERPSPLAWLGGEGQPTLSSIVRAVNAAGERDDLDVVLIRLRDASLSMAQVEEIGSAIVAARRAGKRVHVFSEMYGPAGLMLGAFADEVVLQQGGTVSLPGMHMEEIFLADALKWLGVEPDFIQVGAYKGADEMFTRSGPSPEWDENITGLLDGLYGAMRTIVMRGRGLDEVGMDRAMQTAWWADAAEAMGAGLIDAAVDLPLLEDHLGRDRGAVSWVDVPVGEKGVQINANDPFAFFKTMNTLFQPPVRRIREPSIAVVHIDGPIMDGDSSEGGLFGGGGTVGSRTIRRALEEILDEDQIKGVIVRIESPGGSATASEVIWQGLRRVAEQKPVWVSVGSMATSGGYYIAVGGDKIYVNESSIVGSIGVVGGNFAIGALYDKLNIRVVPRSRGPMASAMGSAEPWTAAQRGRIRGKIEQTYELFASRVSAGRPGIDLSATAEGRLFTGRRAVELKMADEVGGLADAVAGLAGSLGLEDPGVVHYPGPKGLAEVLEQMFGGMASAPGAELAPAVAGLREALGPEAWPAVRDGLEAMMLMRREPVLLVMPRAIVVR